MVERPPSLTSLIAQVAAAWNFYWKYPCFVLTDWLSHILLLYIYYLLIIFAHQKTSSVNFETVLNLLQRRFSQFPLFLLSSNYIRQPWGFHDFLKFFIISLWIILMITNFLEIIFTNVSRKNKLSFTT